jgi:hypothetical protein
MHARPKITGQGGESAVASEPHFLQLPLRGVCDLAEPNTHPRRSPLSLGDFCPPLRQPSAVDVAPEGDLLTAFDPKCFCVVEGVFSVVYLSGDSGAGL